MTQRWKPQTDEELDREIKEARRRSKIADATEPRAASARYNRRTGRIEIELKDGCMFAFPAAATQGLHDASAEQIEKVEVAGEGYALHWDEIDVQYTVPGLLMGRLGTQAWMREHARRAGSVTTPAKARAARRNGRKGGRPRGSTKSGKA